MDSAHFDALMKALGHATARRVALALLAGLGCGRLSWLVPDDVAAAKSGKCKQPCGECEHCQKGKCHKTKDGKKRCKKGTCQPQPFGTLCGGGGQICQGTSCACPPGTVDCNGTCVNLATNGAHCGACNFACATGGCVHGVCTCQTFMDCECDACGCSQRKEGGRACTGPPTMQGCATDADCPFGRICLTSNVCAAVCVCN